MLSRLPRSLERYAKDDRAFDEDGTRLDEWRAESEAAVHEELENSSEALVDPETDGEPGVQDEGGCVWM